MVDEMRNPLRTQFQCEQLEVRQTPAAFSGQPFSVALADPDGNAPLVRLLDPRSGSQAEIQVFTSSFRGGVRTAIGDVNGDGTADLVVAAGPGGGPHLRVFNGTNGQEIRSFFAYDLNFRGGVEVAVGDVNRDGFADIIVGAGPGGGPHVRIFDGQTGGLINEFMAFALNFRGGVRVAAADLDVDGFADIIVGAGPGGGPHVRAWSLQSGRSLADFFPYAGSFSGGVFVAGSARTADEQPSIITGAGAGGGPHVRSFSADGKRVVAEGFVAAFNFTGGVRVAAADVNRDGADDIIAETQQNSIREQTAIGANLPNGAVRLSRWVGPGSAPSAAILSDYTLPTSPIRPAQQPLEGRVLSRDPAAGTLTISLGSGQNVALSLRPADDVRISLNGEAASLEDVRPGDWVRTLADVGTRRVRRVWAWGTVR
jgi:hypothetical protein